MTDRERFVELYRSFGIEWTNRDLSGDEANAGVATVLRLEADSQPRVEGYSMFFTEVAFDADGKFLWQGVWE